MCMTFSSFSLLGSEHFTLHVIFNWEEHRLDYNFQHVLSKITPVPQNGKTDMELLKFLIGGELS